MRIFTRVVELGSFARAAEMLAMSRARVSEVIAALERALGGRLLHRTTRRVSLTDDGRAYYERCIRILGDVAEAEELVAGPGAALRGRLRVDMPVGLARHFVVPRLPSFFARHPELALDIRLENRVIDLVEEGIDCAITYGLPVDTSLVARQVGTTHLVTCAAPGYLAARAAPRTPDELKDHNCIAFLALATGRPAEWLFERNGTQTRRVPAGNLAFNSMEACVEAAGAALGITQVLSSLAHDAIISRRLAPVLLAWAVAGPPLYVVYPPNRRLSARIRAFADFAVDVFAAADAGWRDILTNAPPHRRRRR
jgi:LysR family transcriptional regulator, regulator for bpeEF and oprC